MSFLITERRVAEDTGALSDMALAPKRADYDGSLGLHEEFEDSLGYMGLCLRRKNNFGGGTWGFETRSHYVTLTVWNYVGLRLTEILPPLPPHCQNQIRVYATMSSSGGFV